MFPVEIDPKKVVVYFQTMISRFNSAYPPHQNISLDEGMIPWRGNLSFRVYSPDKPVKYGIKAYIWFQILPMAMFQNVNYTGKSRHDISVEGSK
jgi:hypothetical protein